MRSIGLRSMVIDDSPPAGTACAPCRRQNHYCPARAYRDDEPACAACVSGDECETMQALRRLSEPWTAPPEEPHLAPVRTIDPETVLPAPQIPKVRDVTFSPTPETPITRKEKPMPQKDLDRPICKADGCTYIASRKGSFCTTKHYYLLQKELRGDGVPRVLAAEAAAEIAAIPDAAVPYADGPAEPLTLTLRLTEQQCDALYNRCTPEQKATALSSLLHQMLAI